MSDRPLIPMNDVSNVRALSSKRPAALSSRSLSDQHRYGQPPKLESRAAEAAAQIMRAEPQRLPLPELQAVTTSVELKRKPLKIGFVVNTFSFGGSETETIELVYGADPRLLRFSGIAVCTAQPLPEGEPPKDGSFPPIYAPASLSGDPRDPRVRIAGHFKEAVEVVTHSSDIVITWGLANLHEYLPPGRLPKMVVLSKDSGDWAKSFLRPNSMLTRHYVGNSSLAAAAFPEPLKNLVRIIPNGINPNRVRPRLSKAKQRRLWGLAQGDKVAGYLGRIERDKGVSKTVEGIAQLPPEWKAVFVGISPNSRYTNLLTEHCERAIPGRYRLLPWCHDVGSALAAFDVFCQPSEHEGFSNSIGEAWLAGVPTVYTRDTGAIPDLGELGIGVSIDADGREIAEALLKAYGNRELIRRARHVIENGYLVAHNVSRWTNYLLEVHQQQEKPRVLLLLPRPFANNTAAWVQFFTTSEHDLDLCCVAFEGPCDSSHTATDAMISQQHHCACFHIGTADDVAKVIGYTHPDLVVTTSSPALDGLLSERLTVQTVILPRLPEAGSENWNRWANHLANLVNNNVLDQSRS